MKLKKDKELLVLGWIILLVFGASSVKADEIKHQFKNPSFSGIRDTGTLSYNREPRVQQKEGNRRCT